MNANFLLARRLFKKKSRTLIHHEKPFKAIPYLIAWPAEKWFQNLPSTSIFHLRDSYDGTSCVGLRHPILEIFPIFLRLAVPACLDLEPD
jgi:hypothetical protein